jgi:hypothetical protein
LRVLLQRWGDIAAAASGEVIGGVPEQPHLLLVSQLQPSAKSGFEPTELAKTCYKQATQHTQVIPQPAAHLDNDSMCANMIAAAAAAPVHHMHGAYAPTISSKKDYEHLRRQLEVLVIMLMMML